MSKQPKGVADHPAKDQMEHIWRSGGRAKEIAAFLEAEGFPTVSQKTIARYGQRFWTEKVTIDVDPANTDLSTLVSRVNTEQLGLITKISISQKKYPGWEKINGESVQVEKESVGHTIEVVPFQDSELSQARIADININIPLYPERKKPDGWKLAFNYPDIQFGYHRDNHGNLTTTHDEAALSVAHQIHGYCNQTYGVDLVINNGDNLDFPAFSDHRSAPGYMQTTQLAIDRAGTEAAIQRSLSPDADDIVWIEGNHEARMIKWLVDRMPGAIGLSRAGEKTPVLSIANLCKFDEYGINYRDPYPEGEYWANDYLKFEHGRHVSAALGATAAKHLANSHASVIYGHIHRQELVTNRVYERDSSRVVYAGSAGTLARIDGTLPSGQTGIRDDGHQGQRKAEKWQQGLFVVWYEPEGQQRVRVEPVLIENGFAMWDGHIFTSQPTESFQLITED